MKNKYKYAMSKVSIHIRVARAIINRASDSSNEGRYINAKSDIEIVKRRINDAIDIIEEARK